MDQGTIIEPVVLLIGPYDLHRGEYTFLAPPLGVWRLAGALERAGVAVKVFDTLYCDGAMIRPPQRTDHDELHRAIAATPYTRMPYGASWEGLETACRIGAVYCNSSVPTADSTAVLDMCSAPLAEITG